MATDVVLLALRLLVGLVFIVHGLDKYEVNAAEGMEKWFISLKLPLPGLLVRIVRSWEVTGGIAVALGFAHWAGPVMLIAVMLGAIRLAHWQLNPRVTNSGWEYAALLLLVNVLFIVTGFGRYALDSLLPLF